MIAIVRLRGGVNAKKGVEDTLDMLNLKTVNNCTVVPDNAHYRGMIHKVKDYITYGTVEKETFKKMLVKWGRTGRKRLALKDADKVVDEIFTGKKLKDFGIKPVFRLHPPKRGYEGVKIAYAEGGALGDRKEKINALLERMI